MATNANNKVLPLAFAVVDKESGPSWGWFLERLRISQEDVIADKDICVISVDIRVFKTQLQTNLEMMMDEYEYFTDIAFDMLLATSTCIFRMPL